jgi:GNAT superfamily N-acetyltransferase
MVIVNVDKKIKSELKSSTFSSLFLNNCLNSKFLAIEKHEQKIIGACFVGGLLNSNGIEILDEFQGKGLGKTLLKEIIIECNKRNISFLTGVFKPTNLISIKTHLKIGYVPVFTFFYNKFEGKEIVVILPFTKKGTALAKFLKIFNTKIGNFFFALFINLSKPLLKSMIAFSDDEMPKMDLKYSIKSFEKVQTTLSNISY